MKSLFASPLIVCLIGLTSAQCAIAQSRDQARRETVQAEWEKLSAKELLCIDNRMRRARRSVNFLIDRGIGPMDSRAAGIVRDCSADAPADASAVTPSFDCRAATYPDEKTICGNPELARLDRMVVAVYEDVLARKGSRIAKNISEPLLEQRHACGTDFDCIKQMQMTAIGALQARRASLQPPATMEAAPQVGPVYAIDNIRLGGSVSASQDFRDFDCAPSRQYTGLTACQRRTSERSRRRRTSVSTSLLHAADGSVVYVGQNLDPVHVGNDDAEDEIARLSETLGKAALLPTFDSRGARRGVIASWGAVSLRQVEQNRVAALASGADDEPGILIDHIGNPRKSAQSGLPIYRLDGGPGYVWAANWGGRGRGSVRMVAIDPLRLPGGVAAPTESAPQDNAGANTAEASAGVTLAPQDVSSQTAAKPPAPTLPATSSQPAAVETPETPSLVRVVGPPIELRRVAEAKATTTSGSARGSQDGKHWWMILAALFIALLGAIAYFYRKSKATKPMVDASAFTENVASAPEAREAPRPLPAISKTQTSVRMDLPALAPAEPLGSIARSPPDMIDLLDAVPAGKLRHSP